MVHEFKNKVDNFIYKLFESKEIAIHPNATKYNMKAPGVYSTSHDILEGLTDAIYVYQKSPGYAPYLDECYWWIQKAEAYNVIISGKEFALEKELKDKDRRIAILEQELLEAQKSHDALVEEHQKVLDDNIAWQNKYQECDDKYIKLIGSMRGGIQP